MPGEQGEEAMQWTKKNKVLSKQSLQRAQGGSNRSEHAKKSQKTNPQKNAPLPGFSQ
jgi:hypothetical protein